MIRFIPLIALALVASPASAAGLTLANAVDKAVSEHPDAQEGRMLAAQAAADVQAAKAAFDPSLRGTWAQPCSTPTPRSWTTRSPSRESCRRAPRGACRPV